MSRRMNPQSPKATTLTYRSYLLVPLAMQIRVSRRSNPIQAINFALKRHIIKHVPSSARRKKKKQQTYGRGMIMVMMMWMLGTRASTKPYWWRSCGYLYKKKIRLTTSEHYACMLCMQAPNLPNERHETYDGYICNIARNIYCIRNCTSH